MPGLGSGWELHAAEGLDLGKEASPLEGAFGRGGILRLGEAVVRPYKRGGLVRHLNRDRYLGTGRFESEYRLHAALWEAGFPTVRPLGFGCRRRGLGWQGLFLTAFEPLTPWPRVWSSSPEVLPRLAELLRWLSEAAVWAPDLNATNVMVRGDGELLLLDWDRAGAGSPADLAPRYLDRMRRSLRRLGAPEEVAALAESLLGGRSG